MQLKIQPYLKNVMYKKYFDCFSYTVMKGIECAYLLQEKFQVKSICNMTRKGEKIRLLPYADT